MESAEALSWRSYKGPKATPRWTPFFLTGELRFKYVNKLGTTWENTKQNRCCDLNAKERRERSAKDVINITFNHSKTLGVIVFGECICIEKKEPACHTLATHFVYPRYSNTKFIKLCYIRETYHVDKYMERENWASFHFPLVVAWQVWVNLSDLTLHVPWGDYCACKNRNDDAEMMCRAALFKRFHLIVLSNFKQGETRYIFDYAKHTTNKDL